MYFDKNIEKFCNLSNTEITRISWNTLKYSETCGVCDLKNIEMV